MKNLLAIVLFGSLACSSAPIAIIHDAGVTDSVPDAGVDAGPTDGGSEVCPTTRHLCSGACVTLSIDRENCGDCGLVVNDQEVCLAGQIIPGLYSSACAYDHLVLVTNAAPEDNAGVHRLIDAMNTHCHQYVLVEEIANTNIRAIDVETHLVKFRDGALILAAGGPGSNVVVASAEARAVGLQLQFVGDSQVDYIDIQTGVAVFTMDPTSVSATHDYLLIQANVIATTNQLVLTAYGYDSPGTQAALAYVTRELPVEYSLIIEWTAGPNEGIADDTFDVKVSL